MNLRFDYQVRVGDDRREARFYQRQPGLSEIPKPGSQVVVQADGGEYTFIYVGRMEYKGSIRLLLVPPAGKPVPVMPFDIDLAWDEAVFK